MPFTFAHPAIVLPLINKNRKIFSASGLIIGSICPDFESFIRFDEHKLYSHIWQGIFWFDLPIAVLIAFVFHNLVRDELIKNLPDLIGDKFDRFIGFNWNRFFRQHFMVVIFSMLIGIASHLLWDAITQMNWTHPTGHNRTMVIWNVYIHIILQKGSSVIGLIIIGCYILKMPSAHNESRMDVKNKPWFWMIVTIVAIATMMVAIILIQKPIPVIVYIDMAISGILLGLIFACIVRKFV